MKAAVVVSHGRVEVRDIPAPQPNEYEALVKIDACGLCGTTDRHIVEGRQAHHPAAHYPAVLGHEALGTVVEVGKRVTKFKVGDRVTRPAAIWPGAQRDQLYSAWGGFAEYGFVRQAAEGAAEDYTMARQHGVPPELPLESAVLAISVSEVASWMGKVGKLGAFKGTTIVIGGAGFAACVMAQCARIAGAKHIVAVGRSRKKFEWVLRNGATDAITLEENTGEVLRKIAGGKADWFLDAAGHQAVFEAGLRLLKPGGAAAIYGAPEGYVYKLPLGAVGGDFSVHLVNPADDLYFDETCALLAAGSLRADTLLTHVWEGLESINQALEDQAAGRVLKGLVRI